MEITVKIIAKALTQNQQEGIASFSSLAVVRSCQRPYTPSHSLIKSEIMVNSKMPAGSTSATQHSPPPPHLHRSRYRGFEPAQCMTTMDSADNNGHLYSYSPEEDVLRDQPPSMNYNLFRKTKLSSPCTAAPQHCNHNQPLENSQTLEMYCPHALSPHKILQF